MKALVTLSFAVELADEDALAELARGLDESLFQSITKNLHKLDGVDVEALENDHLIDWYGATISVKRSIVSEL